MQIPEHDTMQSHILAAYASKVQHSHIPQDILNDRCWRLTNMGRYTKMLL